MSFFAGSLIIVVVLITTGCGGGETQKSEPAPAPTPATTQAAPKSVPPPVESIKAPQAYSDPARQKQFEALFEKAKSVFSPPRPGILIRVEPVTGDVVVGELIRFTASGLVVATPESPLTFDQAQLKEENQAELFVDAFAEKMAKVQMDAPPIDGVATGDGINILPPTQTMVRDSRQLTAERMIPRAGPGRHYVPIENNMIYRGTALRVLDEIRDWICVSEDRATAPILGWIPKHSSSVPFGSGDQSRVNQEVEAMRESGFLVRVSPEMNEAVVDSYLWRISDSATVEGMGRLLARYCGQQKNMRVFFVVIKDGSTGQKLAEYSETRGFKVF